MKKRALGVLVLAAVAGLAFAKGTTDKPKTPAKGDKVISFTTTTTDGKKVVFPDDFKGKVVLLDFWATWCGPCMGEAPNVVAVYKKYHEKGFEILGISLDNKDT